MVGQAHVVYRPIAGLQPGQPRQQPRRVRRPSDSYAPALACLPCRRQLRHWPLHDVARLNRPAAASAREAWLDDDPDAYCEEPEDPDDYGFYIHESSSAPERAVAAHASATPRARTTSPSSGGSSSNGAHAAHSTSPEEGAGSALQRAYSALLLCGAALARLLSRLNTAVLATARVTWQLGRGALEGLRKGAASARGRAAEAYAKSPAAVRLDRWKKKVEAVQHELPEDLWGKLMWVWDRPHVQKLRLTISMANFSIRLPALVALVATQVGLLSTSLSLPMLAPLLLGTGMLLRSIRTNASLVFPRIGLLVVLLWLLWFANSVVQNTVAYLRKQGALDPRLANNINSAAELASLLTAAVILLSMLGVNVSALLLPAGVALALAAKDLSHNFLAGFFLMMVQPFRLGDRVGVTLPGGSPGGFGASGSWFEGVCEKMDLRYTSLRQGKRRLMVPNSAFLQQPFMILEDAGTAGAPPGSPGAAAGAGDAPPRPAGAAVAYQPFITRDGRDIWQASYLDGGPVHQEVAAELAASGQGPPPPAGAHPQEQQQQQPMQQQQQHQARQEPGPGPLHAPHAQHAQQPGPGEVHPHASAAPQHAQQQQQPGGTQPPPTAQYPAAAQGGTVYYSLAPPPPPGSFPGAAPPGSFPLYPRSHPLPPHTLM